MARQAELRVCLSFCKALYFSALARNPRRACEEFVRGSMGCPALGFLDFFGGPPRGSFFHQGKNEQSIKRRAEPNYIEAWQYERKFLNMLFTNTYIASRRPCSFSFPLSLLETLRGTGKWQKFSFVMCITIMQLVWTLEEHHVPTRFAFYQAFSCKLSST